MNSKDINEARKTELRKIERANGGVLLPEAVVEYAKDESTALHSAFEWDDSAAAVAWRVHQARNLIRVMVQIVEDPRSSEPMTVRMYTALSEDEEGYKHTPTLLRTPAGREAVLATARAELAAFERKYAHLEELAVVFSAIRKLRVA